MKIVENVRNLVYVKLPKQLNISFEKIVLKVFSELKK